MRGSNYFESALIREGQRGFFFQKEKSRPLGFEIERRGDSMEESPARESNQRED